MTGTDVLLWIAVTEPVVLAIGIAALGAYVRRKAENLASKEDLGALTHVVESVKSEFRVREELVRRRSKVHQRQVEALLVLHASLAEVLATAKSVTSAAPWAGGNFERAKEPLMASVKALVENFRHARLLYPPGIIKQADEFLTKMAVAMQRTVAARAAASPPEHELYQQAESLTQNELPALLQSIEEEARRLIYGTDSE